MPSSWPVVVLERVDGLDLSSKATSQGMVANVYARDSNSTLQSYA